MSWKTIRTNVVNHAYCEASLSAEDKMNKKTLEEVHTYAELKHDPRASLPDSFTIDTVLLLYVVLNVLRGEGQKAFACTNSINIVKCRPMAARQKCEMTKAYVCTRRGSFLLNSQTFCRTFGY